MRHHLHAEIKSEAPETLEMLDEGPARLVRELMDAQATAAAAAAAAAQR